LRALTTFSIAFVRVLALADKRPPMDPALMAQQMGAQAVLLLGDLDLAWIETLRALGLPKLGVHGNHDTEHLLREVEVDDLHLRRTSLGGMTFAGFEGCVQYGGGPHHYHYTQRKASRLAKRLPAADVLLCHCPPRGVNDDPDDPAHIGWDALRDWVLEHRPRWLLHGHVHPVPVGLTERVGDTRVVYVNGARVLELD
jgi:Icc-related predicted phosphoesterase